MPGETEGDGRGGGRRLRRLLLLSPGPDGAAPDQDRPLLASTTSTRKAGFGAAGVLLRGLGGSCSSSAAAQAYAPPATAAAAAVVRSSADWQVKRSGGRRTKEEAKGFWKKGKNRDRHQRYPRPPSPLRHSRRNAAGADIWCAPGIAEDDSVDCVHPRLWPPPAAGGRGGGAVADGERVLRERPCMARRGGRRLEQLASVLDSPPRSTLEASLFGSESIPSGHRRHMPNCRISPGGLEEVMMLQSRVYSYGIDVYDRYWDWRLDVDNMTYEELLELGDKIGHVKTGLREEEIFQCLRRTKNSIFGDPHLEVSIELERKCSICQEEYEVNDELGKLDCGHCYHMYCIKQWLLQKNACPVCKTAAARS